MPFEHSCPSCGNHSLIPRGFGSERVEDQIQLLFPDARILRVDRENAPRGSDLMRAWEKIEKREVDIIVGTRLLAKGLDFPNIQLVVILNADQMLYFPDFRSTERTFSLIHQMSGRAGRGKKNARVIVQSYSPDALPIRFAEKNDYESFFESEIQTRQQGGYPPFAKLILLESRDPDKDKALSKLTRLANFIENDETLKNLQILGPVEAFINRISGKYRYHMLIKSRTDHNEIESFKRIIKANDKYIKNISVIVDPRKAII
jgi:primosomal protein N' (replication factor Y)